MITLRPFQAGDFAHLLDLANQAVPFAPRENEEWLAYRKAFDETKAVRRHFMALDGPDARPVGYGCLEQQGESVQSLRIYVVCRPDLLAGEVGEALFTRLLAETAALDARHLWARELAADAPIRRFFLAHGFSETRFIELPDYPRMVLLERTLD